MVNVRLSFASTGEETVSLVMCICTPVQDTCPQATEEPSFRVTINRSSWVWPLVPWDELLCILTSYSRVSASPRASTEYRPRTRSKLLRDEWNMHVCELIVASPTCDKIIITEVTSWRQDDSSSFVSFVFLPLFLSLLFLPLMRQYLFVMEMRAKTRGTQGGRGKLSCHLSLSRSDSQPYEWHKASKRSTNLYNFFSLSFSSAFSVNLNKQLTFTQ